ncbi:MAG TPA: hypothetical protein VGM50_08750 [Gemmatimonadaceae bacterium]
MSIQVDDDDESAGPFRVVHNPGDANNEVTDMTDVGLTILLDGINIEAESDLDDPDAFDYGEMAFATENMGSFISDFCSIEWNYNVVGDGLNDGVVPYISQAMPNARSVTKLDVSHPDVTSQGIEIRNQLDLMAGR